MSPLAITSVLHKTQDYNYEKNFITLALLITGSVLYGGTTYQTGKASNIKIDGILNEKAWQSAKETEKFSKLAWDAKTKKINEKTTAKFLVDDENLYVGIVCEDQNMQSMRSSYNTNTGKNPWIDDCVELFFAPTGLPETFYQFAIAAGGGTWQQFYAEGGNIRPEIFMPLYESKVYKGKNFWSVEVKIPFRTFYMTNSEQWKPVWLANVTRQKYIGNDPQYSSWSKLRQKFLEPKSFNTLSGIPPKKNISDFKLSPVTFISAGKNADGSIIGKLALEATAPEGISNCVLSCNDGLIKNIEQKVLLKKGQNIIRFSEPALFKNLGSTFIRLTLKNSQGKILVNRLSPVNVAYVPISLKLTTPGYGNCFYPGQKAEKIAGNIIVQNGAKKVKVTCENKSIEIPVRAMKAAFEININDIPKDELIITATAGKNSITTRVRKLKKNNGTMTWIENGRFMLNGKPTFYLDFYAPGYLCSRVYLENFKNNPLPTTINFRHTEINLQPSRLIKDIEKREATKDIKPCKELFDKIAGRLNPNSNRCYYYLSDEPECRGVSKVYLKHIYDYIKERDPYHVVMIISREPQVYEDCSDIYIPHPYLNPTIVNGQRILDRPVSRMRDIVKKCQGNPSKVIMICPGTYSTGYVNPYADYPNFDEMYANMWSAVCEGAMGFIPYIEYDHVGSPDLRHGVRFMFESARRLEDIICGLDTVKLEETTNNSQISSRILKASDGRILIMFANVSPKNEKLSFECKDLHTASFPEFRGNGTLKVVNGKANISFAPYEVKIFTSKKLDEGLTTLANVRKQIADDKKLMANRGNILYQKGRDIEISFSPGVQRIGTIAAQVALFDGIYDICGFMPAPFNKEFYLELAFPKFTPKFSKAKIHGFGTKGVTFQIWKYGQWITPQAARDEEKYVTTLDFGKTLSTVKIKITFKPDAKRGAPEMYELELF